MNKDHDKSVSTLLARLLAPDEPNPAGESLDDSGEVDALLRSSLGTPETEVAGHIIPGRPANWLSIEEDALKLLSRSVDVRLVILLAEAGLRTGRPLAFADALKSIALLVRDHWNRWYPHSIENGVLDIEEREIALVELRSSRVLSALRAMRPFSQAPLRALHVSDLLRNGDQLPFGAQVLRQTLSQLGVRGEVERIREALASSVTALREIAEALNAKSIHLDFARLSMALSECVSTLDAAIQDVRDELATEPSPQFSSEKVGVGSEFTRESAKQVLQSLIDYFGQIEPSSPVPFYLKRAQLLIGLSFEEAVKAMGDDVGKFSKT